MKYNFYNEDKYERLKSNWRIKQQLFLPLKQAPKKFFFQYRTFDGFWSIIKSDSIWARNIRFSNDNKERKQGIDILSEISRDNGGKEISDENDYFMICFCEENDRLSQWRGYAPKGGVSIGFDFRSLMPYRIKKRNNCPNDEYVDIIVSPCPVHYTTQEKKNELVKQFQEHDVFDNRENEHNVDPTINLRSFVPYIKDSGFEEEMEWRIIISEYCNSLDKNTFRECIHFERNGEKQIPYVIVEAGANEYQEKNSVVRIQIYDKDVCDEVKTHLSETLESEKTEIICCDTYSGRTACYGCSQKIIINNEFEKNFDDRKKDEYIYCCGESGEECVYPKTENQIIVSQGKNQEKVFNKIDSIVYKLNKEKSTKIKIWCEGHLPIRSITVSPCENKEEIVESIKNYCQNSENYWLRYVEVDSSKIPYRAPIEK